MRHRKDMTCTRGFKVIAAGIVLALGSCVQRSSNSTIKVHGPELFLSRCTQCHSLDRVLEKRDYNAEDWSATVDNMLKRQDDTHKISARDAGAIKRFLSDPDWLGRIGEEMNKKKGRRK